MMTGRSGGIAIEMNEQEKTETEWPGRKEESAEDRALAWKPLRVEHVVRDQWIDFRRIRYELPDGSVYEPFYSYSRRSYVVIVASDEEGRFLCVRQYRPGIRAVTTEFPAGGIERHGTAEYGEPEVTGYEDGTSVEDALSAAKRELREETGYTSEEWTPLISIPSCASISDNFAYIFRAKHCRKVSGLKLDETEFLKVHSYTAEELDALIRKGQFQQAVHVMAWLLAKEQEAGRQYL